MITLSDVCGELRNYFEQKRYIGHFAIQNGELLLPPNINVQSGQYIRIIGSAFNDGIYTYPVNSLRDEIFDGAVWLLGGDIYQAAELTAEINEWLSKNQKVLDSPFKSESFGSYSYTKAGTEGTAITWQSQFKSQLSRWRKL